MIGIRKLMRTQLHSSATSVTPEALAPMLFHGGKKGLGQVLGSVPLRTSEPLRALRFSSRALGAVGFAVEAWQMSQAVRRSIARQSARPATAQVARTVTRWSSAWAGAKLFGATGALLGVELGPGAVLTSALGATVGGCVGYVTGQWIARRVDQGT